MTIALSLLLGVLVVFVITLATGYFVAQEFAYMAVDRSRLRARAEAGDASAERTLKVTGRTSFMLSGAQLGITVTGLLVGYVAEPLIGAAFGDLLSGSGVSTGTGVAIGTVLALAFATLVQMVFGELVPKNLAIARPEPVARWLARSTLAYLAVTGWLIWFFDQSSNLLLKALRIEPVHDVESSATPRDLRHIVAESRAAGDLTDEMSILLDRVLDFPRRDVDHALVPRSRVDTVEGDTTVEEVRRLMSTEHSRYPVIDEDDRILGVVHLTDLLVPDDLPDVDQADDRPVTDVMRPPVVVPELMLLPEALAQIVAAGDQLACVVDEYGGLAGIITIEDLVEEIVGDLQDEHDETEEPLLVQDGDGWIVRGDAPLDEIERELVLTLPRGDFETIAGLVIAENGALPDVGDTLHVRLPDDPGDLAHEDEPIVRHLVVDVIEVDQYVPSSVRLSVLEEATRG
ncbi:hemolysin family protein [Aeromicrobium sp. Leaf350]|uniref:hemolysin family protein n=1 Tax=Aeromicrobium sp. Leaf350 TaxID=2876565 RepID=UPI001E4F8A1F|nr:hemolysin family protein [Aeromicrobium sp. Leaf350]